MAVFKKETIFVIAVVLLAFVIRLVNLNQSLWWDEAINITAVYENNLIELITSYSLADFHPPGYFIILWIWGKIFGYSETAMRFPSVIFGVLTVYILFLLGRKMVNQKTGIIAALLLAVSPLHIYYSQEARMYSLAAFAVALSMYFFYGLVKKSKKDSLYYALSLPMVLYSDYVAYFSLISQFLYIFLIKRDVLKWYLKYFLLGSVSILPWLFIFSEQFLQGMQTAQVLKGWKSVVGGVDIKQLILLPVKIIIGRISFENNLFYTSAVVLPSLIYIYVIYKAIKNFNKDLLLFWLWVLIPPVISYLISFWIPIFAYFRLIFIIPAFLLLVSFGVKFFQGLEQKTIIFLLTVINIIFSLFYLLNPNFHREDWKGASDFIRNDFQDKSIILFENIEAAKPFKYYTREDFESVGAIAKLPAQNSTDLKDLNVLLKDKHRIYMFEYLRDVTDPNRILEREIKKLGFSESRVYDFRGVGFVRIFDRIN